MNKKSDLGKQRKQLSEEYYARRTEVYRKYPTKKRTKKK